MSKSQWFLKSLIVCASISIWILWFFISNLSYSLYFKRFLNSFCINLQSNIIYSPTLRTSPNIPDVTYRTPLSVSVFVFLPPYSTLKLGHRKSGKGCIKMASSKWKDDYDENDCYDDDDYAYEGLSVRRSIHLSQTHSLNWLKFNVIFSLFLQK